MITQRLLDEFQMQAKERADRMLADVQKLFLSTRYQEPQEMQMPEQMPPEMMPGAGAPGMQMQEQMPPVPPMTGGPNA